MAFPRPQYIVEEVKPEVIGFIRNGRAFLNKTGEALKRSAERGRQIQTQERKESNPIDLGTDLTPEQSEQAGISAIEEAPFLLFPVGLARTAIQKSLAKAIEHGINAPLYFGKVSKPKLEELNKIRTRLGKPLLEGEELYVFPRVIKKFRELRIELDKMTPDEVADIAYSAVHGTRSKVLESKYPQNQAIVSFRKDLSNLAIIGQARNKMTSLKSAYPKETERIRQALGGGGFPPSGSAPKGVNSPQTTKIPGVQSFSRRIKDKIKKVKGRFEKP